MAHLLAMNVPVKRDPAWSDWAKKTRAKIKSAGIPVSKWQLLYFHMTILFLDDDACAELLTPEFAKLVKSCPALPLTIDKIDQFPYLFSSTSRRTTKLRYMKLSPSFS